MGFKWKGDEKKSGAVERWIDGVVERTELGLKWNGEKMDEDGWGEGKDRGGTERMKGWRRDGEREWTETRMETDEMME